MLKRLEKMRKESAEKQKKLCLSIKKKINYQIGRDMARLAKGITPNDVRAFISQIYVRRRQIACSSKYHKKEVQAAVAQMDHVIRCARSKIRHLKDEEALALREKKAEKEHQEKLRQLLEKERKKHRRVRMAKEHARIFERMPDLPGLRDREEQKEAIQEALAATGFTDALTSPAVPSTSAATAASTANAATISTANITSATISPS